MHRPIVISATIQEFDGERYYLCGHYFQRAGVRLHRHVWERNHGPIPDGHHVHHLDEDRANNQPENLACITATEHLSREHGAASGERGRRSIGRAGAASAAWHRSPAGLDWHRKHYDAVAAKLRERRPAACEHCRKQFMATPIARFCSNACKSAWRRASRLDHESRTCQSCNNEFQANRFGDQRFCSKSCAWDERRALHQHRASAAG